MNNNCNVQNDATHTRDGDMYRVEKYGVYYLEYGEWRLCDNGLDIDGWLKELTPVDTHKG